MFEVVLLIVVGFVTLFVVGGVMVENYVESKLKPIESSIMTINHQEELNEVNSNSDCLMFHKEGDIFVLEISGLKYEGDLWGCMSRYYSIKGERKTNKITTKKKK